MSSRKQQRAASRREQLAAELAARKRRTRNLRLSVGMVVAVVVAAATVLGVNAFGGDEPATSAADSRLVRTDSHRLQTAEDGKVTVVEFLDFECPSCGAMYPVVERLRADYEGKVTFVTRYFPLSMHVNADRAARAAEAAARQGKFEAMYQRMFETQEQWAGRQTPADDLFRGYAEGLGLDMEEYDADYESPATAKRIKKDVDDGKELGVQATPTFFLNGEQVEAGSYEDFKERIDAALAE